MYMQLERILPQWNSVVAYITVSYVIRPDSFEFLVISQCPSYIVSDEPVSLSVEHILHTAHDPLSSLCLVIVIVYSISLKHTVL